MFRTSAGVQAAKAYRIYLHSSITDRETGRSRGFGFVEMPDDGEGQKAIDRINGSEFEGKVLTVNVARPKTERSSGGYGGGNRGGNGGYGGGYNRRRY